MSVNSWTLASIRANADLVRVPVLGNLLGARPLPSARICLFAFPLTPSTSLACPPSLQTLREHLPGAFGEECGSVPSRVQDWLRRQLGTVPG